MKDLMEYKGYYGSAHYDDDDRIFIGRVEYIRSLVSYEADSAKRLRKAFEEAVDDYLELCESRGGEPEKPFKGSFNVRIGPELHRKAALKAMRKGVSINNLVTEALKTAIS
ncbi:MAG: type II toxin-antitoxin system HicB family antitoxin [Nitrospinae bacterium]|nr:type II toxin-antitoxin system HicB family antitoxin [Nitrospinota bacterium]MBF0633679.1 type II toxin-antitoxin system HicB family antitoxin [Nitrospinota bacterium]